MGITNENILRSYEYSEESALAAFLWVLGDHQSRKFKKVR